MMTFRLGVLQTSVIAPIRSLGYRLFSEIASIHRQKMSAPSLRFRDFLLFGIRTDGNRFAGTWDFTRP